MRRDSFVDDDSRQVTGGPDERPTAGKPPTRFADFAIEAKYDGQRGIAILDGGAVTLLSRNGANITSLGVI